MLVVIVSGLAPVVMATAWLIADARQPPEFSPVRQTISVLAGHAGTDSWIVTTGLVTVGTCLLITAAGLRTVGAPARLGLFAQGIAAFGVAACPEPEHGSTPQHVFFTVIGAVLLAIWPILVNPRPSATLTPIHPRVTMWAFVIFTGLLLWMFVEAQVGGALGLAERVSSTIEVGWPFAIALSLWFASPREGSDPSRSSTGQQWSANKMSRK